jgi:hypothetical protein
MERKKAVPFYGLRKSVLALGNALALRFGFWASNMLFKIGHTSF